MNKFKVGRFETTKTGALVLFLPCLLFAVMGAWMSSGVWYGPIVIFGGLYVACLAIIGCVEYKVSEICRIGCK